MADTIIEIAIDQLTYDPQNVRLPASIRGGTQAEIEEYLGTSVIVDQMVASIALNGLLKNMPILVTHLPNSNARYRVKDGNRRLVAVRALSANSCPDFIRGRYRDVVKTSKVRPTTMYAHVAESNDAVHDLLGAIHIESALRWDVLDRSQYITELYDRTKGASWQARVDTVALRVGVNPRTVLRSINAITLYEYAMKRSDFDIELSSNFFSVFPLWNAINSHALQGFIGLRCDDGVACLREGTGGINEKHLAELWFYLYGNVRGGSSLVFTDEEAFRKLGAVVECPEALAELRKYKSLDKAYRKTADSYESFRMFMDEAKHHLRRAREYAEGMGMNHETEGAGHLIAEAETELLRAAQAVTRAKFSVTEPVMLCQKTAPLHCWKLISWTDEYTLVICTGCSETEKFPFETI